MKKCNSCGETKPEEEFYKNRGSCIICVKTKHAKYREENKDKIAKHLADNREKLLENRRRNRADNREEENRKKRELRKNSEKIKESDRKYRESHKEQRNLSSKKYYNSNKESVLDWRKQYKKEHKKEINIKKKENHKRRMDTDPVYRTQMNIRCNINSLFRRSASKKSKKCAEYGIDFNKIFNKIGPRPKDHHLDHIIPISKFDLNDPEHVKAAWSADNLRWLQGRENILKRDSIIFELFTPELTEIAKMIGLFNTHDESNTQGPEF